MISGGYIETIVPNVYSESVSRSKPPGTPGVQVSIPPPHEPSPVFNQRKSGVLEEDRFAQEELLDRQAEEQQKMNDVAVASCEVDAEGSIVLSAKDEVTRVEVAAHVERRKRQLELERKNRGETGLICGLQLKIPWMPRLRITDVVWKTGQCD